MLRYLVLAGLLSSFGGGLLSRAEDAMSERALDAMKQATRFYHSNVAHQGGYLYTYSPDLKLRWGEGKATETEIWVQPPGTPTVGLAYLRAYQATGDQQFLDAALDAAAALIFGQLDSGGWTNSIDFNPKGTRADRYRNGQGKSKGRNYSTLDDDKTQSATRFLIELDRVLNFKDAKIHEATQYALDALLAAQFPSGGFPQGWQQPVSEQPVLKASFPDYDWRTENRVKEYWDYYTLNDGLAGTVAQTLHLAHQVYQDERFHQALVSLGDFLLLAQLPEPQPAWAQQYNFEMHPMWARKFEPPAVSGRESIDAVETLMFLFELAGDRKYLDAVRPSLDWLSRSLLPDGQLARFYELRTNRPLYFIRDSYELTDNDDNLPTHYSFKAKPELERLEKRYAELLYENKTSKRSSNLKSLQRDAAAIVSQLDSQGRWLVDGNGIPLSLKSSATATEARISSATFSKNMTRLSEYLQAVNAR
jgi:PelA/Pel-15E family pectate lyase